MVLRTFLARRGTLVGVAVLAALTTGLALAPHAGAATISGDVGDDPPINGCPVGDPCSPNLVLYQAGAGELNDLTVSRSSSNYTFTEAGSVNVSAPTPQCTQL